MKRIRLFTKDLRRLELSFREARQVLVAECIKEALYKKEKEGGGSFGGRQGEIT
jgi:hypothetical protein